MIHLESDYLEGAHPRILERLQETNLEKTPGYGMDPYCESARKKIRKAAACPDAEIHFLVGGTQANAAVIRALLRPHEGVIAADTGHISTHEAGAIEATGHKILTIPHQDGRITAEALERYLTSHWQDGNRLHMVKPGALYVSHPTEYGTLYSKAELEALRALCDRFGLSLFLDGARLSYGLAARDTDVTLETLAGLCDVFSIGGTKVGALFGEAVVMPRPHLIPDFYTMIKQSGALLAKGRILGIQFDTLFTDELYLQIAVHAVHMAERMTTIFKEKGYPFHLETPTNQQFLLLENDQMKELAKTVSFSFWESFDVEHTVVRLATSWATDQHDIERLREEIPYAVTGSSSR